MFICWVCGAEEGAPSELRDHMESQHILEEDYLKCPQCDSLVVNLLIHYQANHRGCQFPDGVPTQATNTPKTFKRARQKQLKKEKRRQFKQGFFDSAKNGAKMHYRSGWECDVYKILEAAFSVKSYKVEPIAIPYSLNGKMHNYYPDILITFTDDSQLLVEVKPLSQCPNKDGLKENLVRATNDAKWQAAQTYCERRGVPFAVWTERAIQRFARMKPSALTKGVLCNISEDDGDDKDLILVR